MQCLNLNSEEVLVVDVDDLSSNENENAIIDILTTESVPLRLYLEFAREYYNIGMKLEFERVLKAGANVGGSYFVLKLWNFNGKASGQYGRDPHYCEVLYTLATYYIDTGERNERPSLTLLDGGKDLNFTVQLATEFVNRADQIDNKVIWIVIAKGNLFLVLKRVEEALKQFRTALELDNSNIVALMGLASSSVAKGDFKTALEYFQRVLCLHPDLKPDVRVAIDPKNDDALTCLSILDWNEARLSNSEEKLLEVANRLNEAFDVNPLNPLTLLMMGERSLFAKEFEKLELLVNLCLQQTNSKGLRGDAFALKAKALHSQGLYRESLEFYQKAVDGNPDSPVHHFGLGEIYIFLGYLHAIDLLKSTSKDVPIEIYNNIGALFFTSGQLDKAEEFFNRGLDESVDGSLMETESSVTLMYNLARHKEEKGDLEDAEKLHRAILAKHPAYTDSAGIGIALVEVGRLSQAREVLSQIHESASNMPTISVNLAHVLIELGQTKSAVTLAVKLDPGKMALWYDLALVKQQYAQVLNEQPSEKRPLDLLRKATKGLEVSRSFLGDRADTQHPGYDVKHAKERASYCKDVARVSEKKIHETDVLEKQKEERLKAIKESQQKIALDKIEKERLQKEEEERRKAEIERQRRELMERVQMDNVKIREQEQLEEVRKASKRAKEDESDGEKQSDGEERKPKK
ncbi:hypothetical protein BC829DRAFT_448805 [Chytridium lagenaria]|nr:hypothetical protein BC829DRAFT_448805 [Chytridium lagenaria]